MIYAQNVQILAIDAIRNNVGRLVHNKFPRARHASRASHVRAIRQHVLDAVEDAESDPLRAAGALLRYIAFQ